MKTLELIKSELWRRVSGGMLIASMMFLVIAMIFYMILPSALMAMDYNAANTMDTRIISLFVIGSDLLVVLMGWILLNMVQEICALLDWHDNRKKQKGDLQ